MPAPVFQMTRARSALFKTILWSQNTHFGGIRIDKNIMASLQILLNYGMDLAMARFGHVA